MAQINYVSKNQLHWTANLNFDLIYKKAKHCWTLTINFLFPFSWYFFLIMFCFLLNWQENSNYFKIAVWLSDSIKRNFRGLIFTTTNYKKQYCLGHIISLAKLNLCLHTYNFIIKGKFCPIVVAPMSTARRNIVLDKELAWLTWSCTYIKSLNSRQIFFQNLENCK